MLIRMAVAMQVVRDQRGVDDGHVPGLAERPLPDGTGSLDGRDALAYAQRLADDLWRRSCRGEDGGALWIAAQGHSLTIGPVGPDLYGGSTGIALLFAAVAATGGREQDRAAALAALVPVRAALSDGLIGALVGHKVGAGSGIGSVAYGLARVAGLLDRPDLLDDACRAAALIGDRAVADDERLDVVDGSAGALLALLALAEVSGDADGSLRSRADRCGRHLLARRRPCRSSGARVWSAGGEPVTGLSHGAAGIAYALARLAGATGSTEFLDAAAEAVAWENEVLIGGVGTWRRMAVAGHDHSRPINSWCHGAAGIGLARLAGLPVLKGPAIDGDIDAAVAAVLGGGLAEVDHPCCGTLGRAELLLNAGQGLTRPDLVGEARRIGAALVAAADSEGGFQHYPSLPRSVFNPGFWQGSAGIGYMLLRLARPERLPSVLVWE
ncbi:lanthionine synthetase LanC family protein [Skermanella pratensis]|uniref:lanthionine synthetase LanC family protein n=1 Tax=Skermanella pratensis TaxID=2233999 RepID=UPI00130149DE|nr:lanthionine synthetase LanC family protein [Skermanella pratensis]